MTLRRTRAATDVDLHALNIQYCLCFVCREYHLSDPCSEISLSYNLCILVLFL